MDSPLSRNITAAVSAFQQAIEFDRSLSTVANLLGDVLLAGGKLLACGNGGSAADAAHLATEFVVRFVNDRDPFPAICLNTHGGDLTAIGNDYGFDEIFARQVRAFGKPGDMLIVFTTSGNSENVRRALVAGRERGLLTVALTGRNGGRCLGLADHELCVRHDVTARIQEVHQLLLHTLCEIVEPRLQEASRGGSISPGSG